MQSVEIKDGKLMVDGAARTVHWRKANVADCIGTIVAVEQKVKGEVKLDNSMVFENPADDEDSKLPLMQQLGHYLQMLLTLPGLSTSGPLAMFFKRDKQFTALDAFCISCEFGKVEMSDQEPQ